MRRCSFERRGFRFLLFLVSAIGVWGAMTTVRAAESTAAEPRPIPVIYDSDIGDDIDDTWALAFLLKSPELDVKLVVGDYGNPIYRGKLMAKLLEVAGRTDVAVGLAAGGGNGEGRQSAWIQDYDLSTYPGKVYKDGVQAIIDTIMQSPEPITVIAVGPLPNLALALEREPRIAEKARFVGMHGSVRLGYGGNKTPAAEYNVRADASSCQKVFKAPWDMVIAPLDTCGLIHLRGEKYKKVLESKEPLARAVIENYRAWAAAQKNPDMANHASSTLFDTEAVYLAWAEDLVQIEELNISVTDDGMTVEDPKGKTMRVATAWKNMGAFEDLLVQRLTEPTNRFEKDIAAFEKADLTSPAPKGAVLFTGSSSIRMWNSLREDFPNIKTIRRGFGGSQFSDLIHFVDRIVIPYAPRMIFVYEGDNDIASGKSPEHVERDYRTFVNSVRRSLPDTRIGFIAIKPSIARWNLWGPIAEANNRIARLAESDPLLTYVDIATPMLKNAPAGSPPPASLFVKDGLHLSAEGYALWTRVVQAALDSQ